MANTKKVTEAEVVRIVEEKDSDTLFAELQDVVQETVEAKAKNASADEVKGLEQDVKEALEAYNRQITAEVYDEWSRTENPVKTLVEKRFVPGIRKVKFTRDKKTGQVIGGIPEDKTAKASLNAYAEAHGWDCFPEGGQWWAATQKLAYLFAASINKELTGNQEVVYAINEAAQTFSFTADAEPTSKSSRVKALKQIFDLILADAPKADSHDIVYIETSMSRNAGCGKIGYMNTTKMEEYVIDALHIKMAGETYTLDTSTQKAAN